MLFMVKPMLLGSLAVAALAIIVGVGVNVVDASAEIRGAVFMVGAGIAGLIGGAISRRLPPRQQPHQPRS